MPDRTFTIKIRDYESGAIPDRLRTSRVERVIQKLLDRDGSDGVVIVREARPEPEFVGNGDVVKKDVADVDGEFTLTALTVRVYAPTTLGDVDGEVVARKLSDGLPGLLQREAHDFVQAAVGPRPDVDLFRVGVES